MPDDASAALFCKRAGKLAGALGHAFTRPALLERALTHPSFSERDSNQRLEFLGDAVLQLCVSRMLYERFPEGEGSLTRRRQQLVSAGALAAVALSINLGEYLRMGDSLASQGGRRQGGVLADTLEAVLGAVYLDGGMDAADAVVRRLWAKPVEDADAQLDPKGALQAWAAAHGQPEPVYEQIAAYGPIEKPIFEAAVLLSGRELARASGLTKRAAQAAAAQKAMEQIRRGEGQS